MFFTPMSEKYLTPPSVPQSDATTPVSSSPFHSTIVNEGEELGLVTPSPKKRKFQRKVDFPVRNQWMDFLALACKELFNPFMPNRSGQLCFFFLLTHLKGLNFRRQDHHSS
jgi:hypothetical protein